MARKSGKAKANKIVVDAMGGDYAPREVVKGAIEAARDLGIETILVGPQETVEKEIQQYDTSGLNINIQPASEVITMNDDPVRAIRRKPDSSIVAGMNLVKEGKGAAFVSGGSTGAVTAAALLILGRKKHISRPALGVTFQSLNGPVLLLDVGANADCKPQNLLQFAQMGCIYMQKIVGLSEPRIGLLSTGEEETKGNKLARSTYLLLAKSQLNFVGNVEGQDIPAGRADIIVTDGFTGNVVIKLGEGLGQVLMQLSASTGNGGSLIKEASSRVLNHTAGALLLGVAGNVIITHGKSDANSITHSIYLAEQMVEQGVTEAIGS
ncbi:MAG: phosphate acyltransferase PlsX [Dehalococcoidia bacterium]